MEKQLQDLYYNLKNPAAYSGAYLLQSAARKKKHDPKKVAEWLTSQKAYNLHIPVRYRFPRRMYNVRNVGDFMEADLANFKKLKNYNDGYKYVLVCIDVLSKFVFVEALYDKSADSVAVAFEKIFKRAGDRVPLVVQTDKGKEFVAKKTQQIFQKYGVSFRKTKNDVKASCVERFLRTMKGRIWRYFTNMRTNRYIDVLEKIIRAYNFSKHSAIGIEPANVTRWNASQARQNLTKCYAIKRKMRCKYKLGQFVRISKEKKIFGKGYENGFTKEIFKIARISKTRNPVVYYLEDLKQEPIDCFFYEEELSAVHDNALLNDDFEIEKILDTRGSGKNKQVLVRWVGYNDSKFDTWIKASTIIKKNDE